MYLIGSAAKHDPTYQTEMVAARTPIVASLKPGGRLLATFFLLEPSEPPGTVSSEPRFTFAHQADRHAFESSDEPEAAVAYDESWVREHLRANDLVVEEPIRYGTWRGTSGVSFQDMIVASRPG